MLILRFFIALFLIVCCCSCATIFGHNHYEVTVNSTPTNATVSIINKKGKEVFRGVTPAVASLPSSEGYFNRATYEVHISLSGYGEKIYPVSASLNGWYFGNILVGGLLGMLIIDPLTGSMWRISDKERECQVSLDPATALQPSIRSLQIIAFQDVPPAQRSQLVRLR